MSIPKTLRFRSPSLLYDAAMNLIQAGKADLFDGLFVSYESELCQIVLLGKLSFFEYYLIDIETIDDLNARMDSLSQDGWEPYSNTVLYGGNYVQWMSRLKKNIEVSYSIGSGLNLPTGIQEKLTMVEGVQPIKLVERGELFSAWDGNPFTMNLGGSHE